MLSLVSEAKQFNDVELALLFLRPSQNASARRGTPLPAPSPRSDIQW